MNRPLDCIHYPQSDIEVADLSFYERHVDLSRDENLIYVWHKDHDCYENAMSNRKLYSLKHSAVLRKKPDIYYYIPIMEGESRPISYNIMDGNIFGPKLLYPCPACVIARARDNLPRDVKGTVLHLLRIKFTDTGSITAPVIPTKLKPLLMYFPKLNKAVWVVRSANGSLYLYRDLTSDESSKYLPRRPNNDYNWYDSPKLGLLGLLANLLGDAIVSSIDNKFYGYTQLWNPAKQEWNKVNPEEIKLGPAPEMPEYNPKYKPTDYEWDSQNQKWKLKTIPKMKDEP